MTDGDHKVTRHQTEPEDLRASEIRYRRLFESARDGILILDASSRKITDVNPFMVEFLGYSRDEFLDKELWEIGLFKDKHESQTAFGELQATGYIRYEDLPLQTKAGKQLNVEFISNVYRENGHHVIQCNIRDITERKVAEESIRFQARLLDTVEQSVIATNLDGMVIYWNQFAQQLYGWTAQEAIGHHIMGLTTPGVMAEQALEIMSHLRQGESWAGEFNVQRRDGTTFPVQIINSSINDDKGTLVGIVGVSIDITERKRQEASLRELTSQIERQARVFNTTLSSITDFAYIFDRDGRFLYANQALLDLWGLTLDEAVGKNFFDLQYPDDLASRLQQQIQQVFDTRRGLRDETPYTSPTGVSGYYEYIFSPVIAADGTVEVVAGSTRDISERKQIETALRESRERLHMAMHAAKIYTWEMSLATRQVEWSHNLERVIGFHLPPDFATVTSFVHPEDREVTAKLISHAISGGEDYESEFRLVNPKSGEIVWVRGQGVLVGNAQNSPQRFVGITQNITERKHTEILLDTQKQVLEMVVGGSPLAEVLKYLAGIVEHQSGGASIASILLLDGEGRLHNGAAPSLPEDYVQAIEGIKADENVGTCSAAAATCKTIISPDIAADPKWQDLKHLPLGLGLQAAWSLPIVAADKRVLGTFGTYFREKREPTKLERQTVEILAKTAALAIERKQAEEALRDAHERITNIFESITDCFYALDADWRFTYVNPQAEAYFNRSKETMLGRVYTEVFPLTRDSEALARLQEAMTEQKPLQFEIISPTTGKWIDLHVFPADGGLGVYFRDITERHRTEDALRESETRFRAMFEQANVGIVQASFDGLLLKVNPGFCKIVGYSEGKVSGMAIRDLTYPDDYEKEEELTRQLVDGEISGYSIEKRYLRKDGHLVWGQMTATRVSQSSGEPFYMLAIVEDISERKWAEEELVKLNAQLEQRVSERTVELMGMNDSLQAEIVERRRAERERALILRRLVMAQEEERRRIARDLHDQFGQQLTVLILKLGMLKEDCGEQKGLREQVENLEEVAGRLDADVDFLVWELRPTALDDLGLQDALTNFAQNWSKHFSIPVEVLSHGLGKEPLTPDIATVLYRIAQEALNNVAKHARAASVTVLLEGRADAVSLIIEDDGVGFDDENTTARNDKSLGLVGMRERAALVGGTAEVESHPEEGTRVIVRIPVPPVEQKGEGHE